MYPLCSPSYESSDQVDQEKGNSGNNSPRSSGSGPLFFIYSKLTEEEDNKIAERWQQDADGILVFTGLFSGVIAQFLSTSMPDLKPSSGASDASFSPRASDVAVNFLWFLSLGISLTCAGMAIMLQQWARQYIALTQAPRRTPEKQARIHALYSGSIDKLFIKSLNVLFPCYLHLSILLFFVGLLFFLFNFNRLIFFGILWWFMISFFTYLFFTLLPVFQSDSVLYTPVSSFLGSYFAFIFCAVVTLFHGRFQFRGRFQYRVRKFYDRLFGWLLREDVGQEAGEIATRMAEEIDHRILDETIDSLGDDEAMENFFEAIPGYIHDLSKYTNIRDDKEEIQRKLREALDGFLNRTLQSNTVTESVRNSRIIVSLNASYTLLGANGTSQILFKAHERWPKLLESVELGSSLESWCHEKEQHVVEHAQALIIRIIGNAQDRDHRWVSLVKAMCGIPGQPKNFCTLWNEIVREAQKRGSENGNTPVLVLKEMRPTYVHLHEGAGPAPIHVSSFTSDDPSILDQPSSYRLCHNAAHHSGPTTIPPSSSFSSFPFPTPSASPPLSGQT